MSPHGDLVESGKLCFGALFMRLHTGDHLKHNINHIHLFYVDLSTYFILQCINGLCILTKTMMQAVENLLGV